MHRPSFDEQVKKIRSAIVTNGGSEVDVISVPSERKIYVSNSVKAGLAQISSVKLTEIKRDQFFGNLRHINAGEDMTAYRVW